MRSLSSKAAYADLALIEQLGELGNRTLTPLDGARRRMLQAGLAHPILGKWLREARSRIAMRVLLAVTIAFLISAIAPAFTLSIGPILFGIPHVASSLRHLILRNRIPKIALALIIVVSLAIVTIRVLEQYSGIVHGFARIEVAVGLAGAFGAAFAAGITRRSLIVIGALAVIAALMMLYPVAGRLASVHVHNLGVIVLWLLVFRRRGEAWPLALLFVSLAVVILGAQAGALPIVGSSFGVDLEMTARWLTPNAPRNLAIALVLAHALTDSVHYAFWLGVIPDEAARAEGSLTFRMTARSLRRDFGRVGIILVVLLTVLVPVFALFRLDAVRHAYFVFAGFHGYIEGIAIVYVLARARRLDSKPCASAVSSSGL